MKKEKESTVVEDYKIYKKIILLSQTKRCINTFDRFLEVQKYKKRLSKLVLFTDKKEKKSKKRSNRRGEEKRNTTKITPKEEEGYNS